MSALTQDTLRFLMELHLNNSKPWFEANRDRYEASVREPMLQLVRELQPLVAGLSPHYVADPRKQNGSLLRIHRDTRFSANKLPYKSWTSLKLFHQRSRERTAPSFYLHVEPGRSFVGGGLWRPEAPALRQIREFIVDNPQAWLAACKHPKLSQHFAFGGDSLKRAPRGFDPEHPLLDDLKRKDFVVARPLRDRDLLAPTLIERISDDLHSMAPLIDYLCAALDLDFH